jgi:lipid-A-disaccharide synthase-like uncharacterized protein
MEAWLSEFVARLVHPLVLFGFAGQFVFMLRFLVQWYVSERRGRSTVPVAFWWISLAGGLMLATYGLLDRDPVILLGQGLGIAIYVRNLVLIYRRRSRLRTRSVRSFAPAPGAAPTGQPTR